MLMKLKNLIHSSKVSPVKDKILDGSLFSKAELIGRELRNQSVSIKVSESYELSPSSRIHYKTKSLFATRYIASSISHSS